MDKSQSAINRNRPGLQIVTGAFVIVLFFWVVVYGRKIDENLKLIDENQVIPVNEIVEVPSDLSEAGTYKDGSYSATGGYSTPAGREQFAVTLTLKNDIVIASTLIPKAISPTSAEFQKEFALEYKQFVIGKDINTLSLGKVAGSSLTGVGFNEALEKIKSQAEL